jgi:putative DNA primase/helicase
MTTDNEVAFPAADREALSRFVDALFPYADDGSYVHVRSFRDDADGTWRPDLWRAIELNGAGTDPVVNAAAVLAEACASAAEPVVFAAPIATFTTADGACEENLANGLVVMVECDRAPETARSRLEFLLGPPTVIVASGGLWLDSAGLASPKLHLYWRLTEPTRTPRDHCELREARRLAALLAGADGTAIPSCHPLRWPGSWHRKGEPKLARIVTLNPSAEIELGEALELLREATPATGHGDRASAEPQADPRDIAAALDMIPNTDVSWDEWNRVGMAVWRASGGTEEGFAAFTKWSDKSAKSDPQRTRARWDHYASSPPTQIGAGTLFFLARQSAPGWQKPTRIASGGRPTIDLKAPYPTARLALDHFAQQGHRVRYHRGSFYVWAEAAYLEIATDDMRTKVYRFLAGCQTQSAQPAQAVQPHTAMVNNVLDALRAEALVPSRTEAPGWLDRPHYPPAEEIVACQNGLIHLPTLTLLPHTPAFFTLNALDFACNLAAPEPQQWLEFLRQLWPNDSASIEALQEIFGYCLTPDTRQQKIFLLVGPPRSGKGTIGRVLRHLVGADSTVAPTLASLGTNFGLAPLIGKRVAIVSDARIGGRADQNAIVERLLSISGEDALTIDRKYLAAWTGRLQTRFLILSNELPQLADASGALVSRLIVLVLTESFLGREDQGLTDRLRPEMPGILNWSVDGWRRLTERGHFVQPPSALEAVNQLEDLASPVGAFVRDCCETGAEFQIEVGQLFRAWSNWCGEHGRNHPGDSQALGRRLRAVAPWIRITQPRGEGRRVRFYQGIRLR